jgi:hypothetical protein
MSRCTESLWSPDIRPGAPSPREILEAQAFALRDQTDNLLTAEVRTAHDPADGTTFLILDLVVPVLGGTRHRVLTARHLEGRVYPCHVEAEALRGAGAAHSDAEFCDLVRQVLHSGEVKSLALALLARAHVARGAEPLVVARRHNGHARRRPAWISFEADGGDDIDALYDEAHGID